MANFRKETQQGDSARVKHRDMDISRARLLWAVAIKMNQLLLVFILGSASQGSNSRERVYEADTVDSTLWLGGVGVTTLTDNPTKTASGRGGEVPKGSLWGCNQKEGKSSRTFYIPVHLNRTQENDSSINSVPEIKWSKNTKNKVPCFCPWLSLLKVYITEALASQAVSLLGVLELWSCPHLNMSGLALSRPACVTKCKAPVPWGKRVRCDQAGPAVTLGASVIPAEQASLGVQTRREDALTPYLPLKHLSPGWSQSKGSTTLQHAGTWGN